MKGKFKLNVWGPNGENNQFFLHSHKELLLVLSDWANEIGCAVADIDYQVNDGLRIMGEGNPYAAEVD
ncbi:MAG: hypothetical protein CMM56_05470 [Rhodospirillaceae bacterium]|nr:hypothetical protein [Rhodospirillaceae bacterium]|tara:strand:- start:1020 stop:1223 length:204 start_codon:yes stop_codon:yes gene_type:complete